MDFENEDYEPPTPESEDEDIDIGYCQGCGRYGRAGQVCVRRIDGQLEECGEFL